MTPNKELISITKETPAKMGAARVPQFNPPDTPLKKLSGTTADVILPLLFTSGTLDTRVSDGKESMTLNNPTETEEKSFMQKQSLNTEVPK